MLYVIGTSASVPHPTRPAHAAFALRTAESGALTLVDCGPTTLSRMVTLDLDPFAVTDVFLTHQHGDHILGLPLLNNARWLQSYLEPLTVHAPQETLDALRAVTLAVYPDQEERFDTRVRTCVHPSEGVEITALGGQVRSAPAPHSVPSVSYRFDFNGSSVVFSGDSAPSAAVVALAQGADLLIHDATFSERVAPEQASRDHTTAREAGEVATAAGVRRLALVHIPPSLAGHEAELIAESRSTFNGEVIIPSDGDILYL
jgi:ribonuclease Z